MAATCPHCARPIRWLEDICPGCGRQTGQRIPWYAYLLGGLLVLLLFLWLGDFDGMARFIAGIAALLTG